MTHSRGNAFFIILIGIALFAALTYAVSTTGRVGGSFGADDKASLGASGVLDYVRNAQMVVQQMKLDGIAAADISYLKPIDAGYSTAPHDKKIYHPEGGGLPVLTVWQDLLAANSRSYADVFYALKAIGSVGTSANDLVMFFPDLHPDICKKLNLKLRGTDTVSTVLAGESIYSLVISSDTSMADTKTATTQNYTAKSFSGGLGGICASCTGIDMQCINDDSGRHMFYAAIQKN